MPTVPTPSMSAGSSFVRGGGVHQNGKLTWAQDILSNDEMISDVYDLKEVDGTLYEAECQMITVKKGGADIGSSTAPPNI